MARASRQIHRLDAGKRVTSHACEGCRCEREVDVGRLCCRVGASPAIEGVVAEATGKRVVAGKPRERIVTGIPLNGVGKGCSGDILDPRRRGERQRQASHERLRRCRRQVEAHTAIGKGREVERVGVGISVFHDRHACRFGPGEDIAVVPSEPRERGDPRPALHRERVRTRTGRQIRPLDAGERIGAEPGERRRSKREIDVRRLDHRVGPDAAVEAVVSGRADEGVVAGSPHERIGAGQTRKQVVSGVPPQRVGKRRPGDVFDPRHGGESQRQTRDDRLRTRHRQIEIDGAIGKVREVERVGVAIRSLVDRHGRRQRAQEEVRIVPSGPGERRGPRPAVDREPVRTRPGRNVHRLDAVECIATDPGQPRRREREVDVGRLDHGVGPGTAEKSVVPRQARERVVAGETRK